MAEHQDERDLDEAEREQRREGEPGLDEETQERRRQALAEVRHFGDPVLNSPASPVSEFGPDLEHEAERMIAIMHGALGIGLAATQLGLMRRMLLFQAGPDAHPRAIVNPQVEWTSDDLATAEEGCLSLPGIVVDVERPVHARVSASGIDGDPILLEASGLEARVLQHEIDHLDGVLIVDRTEREQRRAAMRALRAGESFSPEMLEPDEGDADGNQRADGEGAESPAGDADPAAEPAQQ